MLLKKHAGSCHFDYLTEISTEFRHKLPISAATWLKHAQLVSIFFHLHKL